jgi:glucokinase
MKKGDIELIKKINKNLILNTIRNHHPISRAKVSTMTNLSRSTVSIIVEDLLKISSIKWLIKFTKVGR